MEPGLTLLLAVRRLIRFRDVGQERLILEPT